MGKINIKKVSIIIIAAFVIIALPIGIYAHKYNVYKSNYSKAVSQLNRENYDECINTFNKLLGTYFGKRNDKTIKKDIKKAENLKNNKQIYSNALNLLSEKKYLEAIKCLKKIPKNDVKRYKLAKNKIEEAKACYISLNIENAENEEKAGKYDSALNYLDLVLKLDSDNKEALELKNKYAKEKQDSSLKAKNDVNTQVTPASSNQVQNKTQSQTSKTSGYPKVVCKNGQIYIYQNQSQEKDDISGAEIIMFGAGSGISTVLGNVFNYSVVKMGPGPDFNYTINIKYKGVDRTFNGNTGDTSLKSFGLDNYSSGDSVTTVVTIIYNGVPYSVSNTFK